MKKIAVLLSALFLSAYGYAEVKPFEHLSVGFNAGTTGVGVDVSAPMCDYVRLRTGFTYLPHFKMQSKFGVESTGAVGADDFSKIQNMMQNFTSAKVDDHVTMNMEPKMNQFKLLVDIMPFKNNKHWNFTVGFYAGKSKIGRAVNVAEAAPTLLGVNIYNQFYTNICLEESFIGGIEIGGNTVEFELPDGAQNAFKKRGMLGMPLGTFKNGDKAVMVPNSSGSVVAEMKVNKFRPYVGVGYTTSLCKDHSWNLTVDAGILIFGRSPRVYVDNVYRIDKDYIAGVSAGSIDPTGETHDIVRPNPSWDPESGSFDDYYILDKPLNHVDMVGDLKDIKGKVGDFVKTASKFKCYPNVGVTLSYRLF